MNQKVDDTSALTDDKLRLAVKYFLTEIPLFAATADILKTGTSVFCYHQRVEFLERFYQGELTYRPRETQGFARRTAARGTRQQSKRQGAADLRVARCRTRARTRDAAGRARRPAGNAAPGFRRHEPGCGISERGPRRSP